MATTTPRTTLEEICHIVGRHHSVGAAIHIYAAVMTAGRLWDGVADNSYGTFNRDAVVGMYEEQAEDVDDTEDAVQSFSNHPLNK